MSGVPDTAGAESQRQAAPLVVDRLNKRYDGGAWANRDISLTAERGEILGILGPNGAGKTTMVRQITTELRPTSPWKRKWHSSFIICFPSHGERASI